MNLQQLLEQLDTVRQQVLKIQAQSVSIQDSAQPTLAKALEEMKAALAELQVAEEELVQQNDEIVQAREQVEAEQQRYQNLRSSEARLVEAQRLARMGHWDWNVAENNLLWSAEMYHIYGLAPQTTPLPYEDFLAHVHPDDRAAVSSILTRAHATGQSFVAEHRIILRDATIRFVQMRGQILPGESGQATRMLGTGQDITERKEIEEQLQRLNVELEQRVADRTRDLRLANEKLRAEIEIRKATERQLHLSRAHFEGIVTLSEDAIISIDREQHITLVNPSVEKLFGYQPAELLGQPLERLLPDQTGEGHRRHIEAFSSAPNGTRTMSEHGPIYGRRKDGSAFPAEASISKFEVHGDLIMSVRLRDITQRLEAEAALRNSEERFRIMADLAPTMAWTAAPDGTITYANQQWREYCGLSIDENATQWLELVLHPDDYDYGLRQWKRALSKGTEYEVEVRQRRCDGEYRWFLMRAVSRRDAEGRITDWFGVATDIHDHRLAEEAIRNLNQELDLRVEELETLLNVLPVGIIVAHDPDCLEMTMNPAGAQFLGLPPDANPSKSQPDAAALPYRILREGQEVPVDELPMQYAIAHATEVHDVELDIVRSDGTACHLMHHALPLYDKRDQVRGCLCVQIDLTARQAAEEAIKRLNQELDRRVEELETLFKVLPVGIAVAHDPDCLDITVNQTAAKMLAIPLEENASKSRPDAAALPFKVLRNGQEVPVDELPMQYAARHDVELHDVELDLVQADGTRLHLLEYASPLYDEHGRVRGCLGVLVDITPRKVAERRLSLQYAVAHALAESMGVSEASSKVLKAVCEVTDSEFGALWRVDPAAQVLRSTSTWQSPHLEVNGFSRMTRTLSFRLNEGLPGLVYSTRQPHWISDMATVGLPRSEAALHNGLHSAFAVPIRSEGEITGVLECFSRTIRESAADLIELLDAIGYQLGLFMERKQAEDDLAMRAHQQAIVAEIGQRALSGLPLPELFAEVVGHVALTLRVGFAGISELTAQGFVLRAGLGWDQARVSKYVIKPDSDTVSSFTMQTRAPLIIEDFTQETRFPQSVQTLRAHGVISGVSVPIPGDEQTLGILAAYSRKRRSFSEDDVHFLQAIAHVLGLAIERNRVEEALRVSRAELATILEGVADGVTALNQDGQRIYVNDALTRMLRFESMDEFKQLSAGNHPPHFDIFDEAGNHYAIDRFAGPLALKGIHVEGEVLRYKFHATGDEMWALTRSKPVFNEAGEVVMAVTIMQDVTELKRIELAQRLLAEAGALLTSALDTRARLEALAQLIVPRLGDWCAIDILDEQGVLQRATVVHVDPAKAQWAYALSQRFPPDPASTTGSYQVIRSGQPIFNPHITPDMYTVVKEQELREILERLDLRSSMVVPLTARGRQLGVMTFVWSESGHHYTTADLELAQELARRAALALDNARLYDEAQRLNVELEQRVLQRTTELQAANIRLNAEVAERRQAEEQIRQLNAELENRVLERTQQLERSNFELQREIIDRKQAEKTLRLTLQKTRELYTLSQHISLIRSAEEVLQVLLASSYLKLITRASVAIFDTIWQDRDTPPAGCTILTAWNREPDTPLYAGQHLTLEDYGLVPPLSPSEILFIQDIRQDPRVTPAMRQRLLNLRATSSLLFPLVASGEWYGMLALHFRFSSMISTEDIVHLRGLVDEAAVAIYNFQLLEKEARARLEAERANNLKLRFLAMISHELRTPLASIKGFASTLLAEDVTWTVDSQHEFIRTIDSEADKLTDLIEQLLDLSRLEAGTMRITPHTESLTHILEVAAPQLQALTTHHHLHLQVSPQLPLIKADRARIAQVITNLVNNAAKYSPPHSNITLTAAAASAHEVKVSVSDEGKGIPPEAQDRIFEAFQQFHHESAGGAGLGLAICRGLVEAHGGRIWVDEHEGPGSTLSFTVPLA